MKKLLKILAIPTSIGLLGMLLNVIVIKANGSMPAYTGVIDNSKLYYDSLGLDYPSWTNLYEGTKFRFLADILPFNLSIGDVLIYGSLLAYVVIVVVWFARGRKVIATSPS